MIDFQEVLVALAIRISLFDEVFKEYFRVNELETIEFRLDPEDPDSAVIPVALEPPDLVFEADRDPPIYLHLRGDLTHPLLPDPVPVDVRIDLPFGLRIPAGEVPVVTFQYKGVAQINDELDTVLSPFLDGQTPEERLESLSELFGANEIIQTITEIELDVARPIVEGLRKALFPEGEAPLPSFWSVALQHLPGDGAQTQAAVGIFVTRPELFPFPGNTDSFLPMSHSLGMAYSRAFMDQVLQAGADAQEGTTIDGATVERLALQMNDASIQVDGEVKKSIATITFSGPVHLQLIRGTGTILTDASEVEVDAPEALIGFLKFLAVLSALSFFGIAALGRIIGAIEDLEAADETVQGGLTDSLMDALAALTAGLGFDTEVGEVSIVSTIDDLVVSDGNLLFLAHVFASQATDTIARAFYSKKLRRFVLFELGSGLRLETSALARLVDSEKIIIDGVHDVVRQHVRTDGDDTRGNNLLKLFGEVEPDEPTAADVPA